MPEPTAPRKPRRFWLFAPYVLVLVLAALWSAGWFAVRDRIETRLEASRSQGANGRILTWASHSIEGFPFRFEISLDEFRFADPSGWGLSAPKLEAMAAAYAPTRLVVVAPQRIAVVRPGKGVVDVDGAVMRASLSGLSSEPRVSVEGIDLRFTPQAGAVAPAFAAAERFEFHLRPQAGDRTQVFLRLEGAAPSAGGLLGRLGDGGTSALRLEAVAGKAGAFRGRDWPEAARSWAAAGGTLDVTRGEASVGQAVLSAADSPLTIDPEGRLQGSLRLTLNGGPTALLALGAVGVLPPETAAVATGLAGFGQGRDTRATLTFGDGQTLIGPLPIGRAPRVYRPPRMSRR